LSGTVRPSAFAVLRLMTSWTLVDCTTGRSAGFSPLRTRPRAGNGHGRDDHPEPADQHRDGGWHQHRDRGPAKIHQRQDQNGEHGHLDFNALGLTGGNMEGKEVRFGIVGSALFAVVTTAASCGAVNAMHDSLTAIGGMVPLLFDPKIVVPAHRLRLCQTRSPRDDEESCRRRDSA
jgi:Potassium-transporting ATPase A subunit